MLFDLLMANPKTSYASVQRFLGTGHVLALQDILDCVFDVTFMPLFHGGREVALAFRLRPVLADNVAAKDLDF